MRSRQPSASRGVAAAAPPRRGAGASRLPRRVRARLPRGAEPLPRGAALGTRRIAAPADADRLAVRVERVEQRRRRRCAPSALTTTTRGAHVAGAPARRRRVSISRISRAVCSASGRSPLLTTRTSAISSDAGLDRLDVVAEARAGRRRRACRRARRSSISDWPVPTVSTMTRSKPAASKRVDGGARRPRQAAELAARRRASG